MQIVFGLLGMAIAICPAAFGDLTVERETILIDPLSGEAARHEIILIDADDFAVSEDGFMGHQIRTVIKNSGEEVYLIDYVERTFSVFDDYLIDSLLSSSMQMNAAQLDSLKSLMNLNTLDIKFTGKTKEIFGLEARELRISVELKAGAPLFDDEIMPLKVVVEGSEWVTLDFEESEEYRASKLSLKRLPPAITRDIFGDYSEFLRKLDASDSLISFIAEMVSFLSLESELYVTIGVGATDELDLKGEPVPAMSWTMKFETSCIDISFEKIQKEEFAIPWGFRKVHNAFEQIGAIMIPGLEKWFALNRSVH